MKQIFCFIPFIVFAPSLQAADMGKALFFDNCIACHGVTGQGDGPVARDLNVPPADLTRIAARRDGVWPMLEIMSIIDGYSRNAHSREDMPVFENFLDNEMVEFDTGNGVTVLVPEKLIEIVTYLEALQDPAPTSYVP
ncbi:cytochrome c [Roseobacter sp.]|uniref:c-type cytochrome n=1 Tax=Roseobacter sp. TaxID=1907202 RepID=UPI0025CF39AD|nr:cytochrome c [Roseobacter sp.]